MIQRIQSIFLLAALLLNVAFIFLPFYGHVLTDPTGWISTGLTVALAFSAAITLFSIFLYNNRPNQVSWVKRAMIFQVIALGMCFAIFFSIGIYGFNIMEEAIGVAVLFLALVCQYMAIHYIRRDKNLVRSMDRIR
ncbi:MAG: DUF4293 family protein [Balneolales bacterium]